MYQGWEFWPPPRFGFVFEEDSGRKSHGYRVVIVFDKLRFQNVRPR